jgi:hypothetical protein
MKKSVEFIFVILLAFGYLASPVFLFWGWVRWLKQSKPQTITSLLSLSGFVFASASGLLAVLSIAFAQVHTFGYYDPSLIRIFRWGVSLSLTGLCLGIGGAWRTSSLRWLSPLAALGTLAFWILSAAGE